MKIITMYKSLLFLSLCLISLSFNGCIDQEFDVPPGFETQSNDISTLSISELKALHIPSSAAVAIPAGTIIKGQVVSDDGTGNFFKDLVIQDGTAGIHIRIDQSDLNTIYPRGRELFVNCDDLFLGEFNGLVQIGVKGSDPANPGNVDRLPEIVASEKLIIGEIKEVPAAKQMRINELTNADLSMLIELQGVEVNDGDVGNTYANSGGGSSQNRTLQDCNENEITMRNSDFADFAGAIMPDGNGTVTGVYSVFGSTKQFTIRDLADVNMNESRCDGTGGGGGGGGDIQETDISNLTIADMKSMHMIGADAFKLASGTIIKGHVISSDETGNFYKNITIQDATGGIQIRIDATDTYVEYPIGRLLYIDCTDLYVGDFNGLPQLGAQGDGNSVNRISEVAAGSVFIKGPIETPLTGNVRTITTLSNDDLNSLVRLDGIQYEDGLLGDTYAIPGGGSAQNRILQDCDGNEIIIRNSDFADWAGTAIPEGNGSITGVFGVFGADRQLFINTPDDINFVNSRCDGSGGGGGGGSLDEDFESGSDFDPISLSGWTNVSTTGSDVWDKNSFSGNGFAQATAFQATDASVDTWLVTPQIDLAEGSILNFQSAKAFLVQDGLTVHFSSDFAGDVNSANWTQINCTLAGSSDGDFDWVDSGDVDLSTFGSSTGYVAFRYQGDPTTNTSTFRIDNVTVE